MSADIGVRSNIGDVALIPCRNENCDASSDSLINLCDALQKPSFSPSPLPSVSSGIFSECATIVSSRSDSTSDIELIIDSLADAAVKTLNFSSDFDTDHDIDAAKELAYSLQKPYFTPCLHLQRHEFVIKELQRHQSMIDTLVDFGVNAGKFLFRARHRLSSIENFIGVDLDPDVLSRAALNLDPDNDAVSFSERALRFRLFCGDAGRYDRRLEMADAVVAIELIEHVDVHTLQRIPRVIFGQIKPHVVIFTTPNIEFNVLFEMNGRRFRHDDHKFEWTRKEFELWCNKIALRFPDYYVKFSGVGEPPEDHKNVGYCTQIAIFRTKRDFYIGCKRLKRQNRLNVNYCFGDKNFDEENDERDDDSMDFKPYKSLYNIKYPTLPSSTRVDRVHCDARNYCDQLKREYHYPDEYYGGRCGNWFCLKTLMEHRSIKKHAKKLDDLIYSLCEKCWPLDLQSERCFFEIEPYIDNFTANLCNSSINEEDERDQIL